MSHSLERLHELLKRYDEKADYFSEFDFCQAIEVLRSEARAAETVPVELDFEAMAFSFIEDYNRPSEGWGTYYGPMISGHNKDGSVNEYPSIVQVTYAIFEYWSTRAYQSNHPVLKFRYAGLVWDLSAKIKGIQRQSDLARVMVDASMAISNLNANSLESVDIVRKLERAHEVATAINDRERVEKVREALIGYELRTAQDHLHGTWGRSFDLLVKGDNKRFPVAVEQCTKLVTDMEARLIRLANESDPNRLDPRAVEAVALRLANFYRRHQQQQEVRQVLGVYVQAHLQKADIASGLLASSNLQQVCDTLNDFGLREEAEIVAGYYRKHAERSKDEMRSITHKTTIPAEEVEAILQSWSEGDLTELLNRFATEYIPSRDEAENQVRDHAKAFPISHMFTSTILDQDGRATAKVGPFDKDIEGHIVRSISQTMSFLSVFLRMAIERMVSTRGLNAESVSEFIARCPVIAAEQREILSVALRAYFEQNWLVAIHLLIPQIENSIRRLVRLSGGSALKQARNGTMPLKTMDDLLRDVCVERAFGRDMALYLRILLTDQRGWNVRNNVCHGLLQTSQFQSIIADRLLHALLCIGLLEARPRQETELTELQDSHQVKILD